MSMDLKFRTHYLVHYKDLDSIWLVQRWVRDSLPRPLRHVYYELNLLLV